MKKNLIYFKLKNDQRGASLAYTLVIIAILMIIGAVLSTFAVMSLRLSMMQHGSDKAFYLSDAAMVESLTQLESYVHEAEIYATSRVNDKDRYYSEPKWQAFLRKLEWDTNTKEISMEESMRYLETASNYEFQKQYYHYIFGKPDNDTLWLKKDYSLLDASGKYVQNNNIEYSENYFSNNSQSAFDFLKTITLDPSKIVGFEATNRPTMTVQSSLKDNAIHLELQTSGTYNRFNKPINLKLALVPPDYAQVIAADSISVRVRANDVLKYGLAARGNIVVSGSDNKVDGNVYTFGTFPKKGDYKVAELGGLLVGYDTTSYPAPIIAGYMSKNANLNITGDLSTRTSIKLYGENSRLNVGGNAYANTITFDKNSKQGDIKINKNAYLFEDLVLDGENPTVTIGTEAELDFGELWGLMDTNPNGSASSLSSSIIVNTKSDSPRLTLNKYFMAGLVYFDLTRSIDGTQKPYQTGEAFTTNNNYYFYKTPLIGFNSALQSDFFEYEDSAKNKHYMIEAIDTKTGNILKSPVFKDKYFYTSTYNDPSSISGRDRNILTVRSLNLNEPSGETGMSKNYSIGVMIANKKVIDAYKSVGLNEKESSDYMLDSTFADNQKKFQDVYDEKTSLLSVRNYIDHNNINPVYTKPNPPNFTNPESNLEQFINFDNGQYIKTDNPKEIIIVNADPTKHVYLNMPVDAYNTLSSEEQKNGIFVIEKNDEFRNLNGMIITKGNVYVYNTSNSPMTYKGTIVSDGDIYLLGTGKKEFTHDALWIAEMSAKHDYLKSAVYTSNGRKLIRVDNTTSRNASLTIGVTDSNSEDFQPVYLNKLPTSSGLVKTKTNYSFKITEWSMD